MRGRERGGVKSVEEVKDVRGEWGGKGCEREYGEECI